MKLIQEAEIPLLTFGPFLPCDRHERGRQCSAVMLGCDTAGCNYKKDDDGNPEMTQYT